MLLYLFPNDNLINTFYLPEYGLLKKFILEGSL